MTVKELIAQLQEMPGDLDVVKHVLIDSLDEYVDIDPPWLQTAKTYIGGQYAPERDHSRVVL